MGEARHDVYDKVGYVKERVEILHGTLLGVYVDWKEGVHDLGVSMEELHEGMGRAQEAAGGYRKSWSFSRSGILSA